MSIFYEVISGKTKKSHLFGIMHINDKEVITLPSEVHQSFEEAENLVLEGQVDPENYNKETWKMLMDWKGRQDFTSQVNGFEECFPILALIISDDEPDKVQNGLDKRLIHLADSSNKTTNYLEDWKEQTKKMLGLQFTYQEQIEFCSFINETKKQGKKVLRGDDLKSDYLKQDLSRVADVNSLFCNTEIPDIVNRYFKTIYQNRDPLMVESMKEYLDKGNAFIAIGFGHLTGVINELRKAGYTVNPIKISERTFLIPETLADCRESKKSALPSAGKSSFFKSTNENLFSRSSANGMIISTPNP